MITFTQYASSSSGNLYSIESNGTKLLIECGLPIKKIKEALGFKLHEYSACIVTHEHKDHAKSAQEIINAGIDMYCSKGTILEANLTGYRLKEIKHRKQFSIENFNIVPFNTQHDAPEPLGFLISDGEDKLLFATDTFYIEPRFRALTMLAIECNYSEQTIDLNADPAHLLRVGRSHMSLETLKEFIEANDMKNVREIHLLHISKNNGDSQFFKREIQKLTGKPVYI